MCDFFSTNRVATQDGGPSKYNIKHNVAAQTHQQVDAQSKDRR
jgi:hypothetical protein